MRAGSSIIPVGAGLLPVGLDIDALVRRSLIGRPVALEAMDDFRVDSNADVLRAEFTKAGRPKFSIRFDADVAEEAGLRMDAAEAARFDSANPAAGLFMSRQLDQIIARVLETPAPPQNAPLLFPVNTEVQPGAKTYTLRRFEHTGEAVIWRGGAGIPRVGLTQEEETRPIRHIASSFSFDIYERASAGFANIGLEAGLLKACRRAILERYNKLCWYGDAASDIWGVLTYPYLEKKVVATPFDGTASPDDVIAELNSMANYAEQQSAGTFKCDTMITSQYVRNYLMNTPRSSTSDMSIGKWWLENNSQGITAIKVAHEMKGGTGTSGIASGSHGILFTKSGDEDAVRLVVPQTFTLLPVQQVALEFVNIAYMSFGGASMPYVGYSLLGFVDVPATEV